MSRCLKDGCGKPPDTVENPDGGSALNEDAVSVKWEFIPNGKKAPHVNKYTEKTTVSGSSSNPNPYSEILASAGSRWFFGRRSIIAKIIQGVSARDPKSFSIRGNRAIGKTNLLKFLCREQDAIASQYSVESMEYRLKENLRFVFVDLGRMIDEMEPIRFLYDKTRESIRWEETTETKNESYKDKLHDMFKSYNRKNIRLVVCLDHFDNVYKSMSRDDEYFLRHLCTNHHSFVIATEKGFMALGKEGASRVSSPLVPILEGINLGLLTKSEAEELAGEPARKADKQFHPEMIDFLVKIAGRHPHLLTTACSHVFDLIMEYEIKNIEEFIQTDKAREQLRVSIGSLTGVAHLFQVFWQNLNKLEKNVLLKIANGVQEFDRIRETPALNILKYMALIDHNLFEGRYYVFSELFRDFVLGKQIEIANTENGKNVDLEKIREKLPRIDRLLLIYLSEHPGQVCTFEELIENVWGEKDLKKKKRGLEAAIHRIRSEIENEDGSGWDYIRNERGEGYKFEPKPDF